MIFSPSDRANSLTGAAILLKANPEYSGAASLLAAHVSSGPDGKLVLVGSLEPGAAAVQTLTGLAATLRAEYQMRVLLVDLDLRSPAFINHFHLDSEITLAQVFENGGILRPAVSEVAPGISVLAGARDPGAGYSAPDAIRRVRDELLSDYDIVLIHVPPLHTFSDALALGPVAGQMILVVESGRSASAALERAALRLAGAGIRLLGVILAQSRPVIPAWIFRRLTR